MSVSANIAAKDFTEDTKLTTAWEEEFKRIARQKSTLIALVCIFIYPATLVDLSLVAEQRHGAFLLARLLPPAAMAIALGLSLLLKFRPIALFYFLFFCVATASTYRTAPNDTTNFLILTVTVYVMFAAIPSLKPKDAFILGAYAVLINIAAYFYAHAEFIPLAESGLIITFAAVILFVLVNKFRYEIARRNFMNSLLLQQQKEEIEEQRNYLLEINEEVNQQKEEILAQRDSIQYKNKALETAMEQLAQKNKNITASINYASRIQSAILSLEEEVSGVLPDKFLLLKPRDIVSGDFYWFAQKEDYIYVAAIDCTGHGVPGAFMSMVGESLLSNIVLNRGILEPGNILSAMHSGIRKTLKQDATANDDGMDIALCRIDRQHKQLIFAGAKRPLVYIQDGKLTQLKGSKHAIGGSRFGDKLTYESHTVSTEKTTMVYLFSDGYQDQFGGRERTKFMIKHLKKLLLEIHQLPMSEQRHRLDQTIEQWRAESNEPQIDDILLIGIRL